MLGDIVGIGLLTLFLFLITGAFWASFFAGVVGWLLLLFVIVTVRQE